MERLTLVNVVDPAASVVRVQTSENDELVELLETKTSAMISCV